MPKKKPCAKKSCKKTCKKNNCKLKQEAQETCNNSLPELTSSIVEIKQQSIFSIWYNYLRRKIGL